MRILLDPADVPTLQAPRFRDLLQLRFDQVCEGRPFDPVTMARLVIVEPGDTPAEIEASSGAWITTSWYDDSHFGDPGFSPCFDFLEAHILESNVWEYCAITSDSGFAIVIFIRDIPGMDEELIRFCREYAQPASETV